MCTVQAYHINHTGQHQQRFDAGDDSPIRADDDRHRTALRIALVLLWTTLYIRPDTGVRCTVQ